MALKITLKPNEKMIIGGAVVCNGSVKAEFRVENTVPVLRQKNILNVNTANSPARRIYFAIQLMYVDPGNLEAHQRIYWELVKDFVGAVPRSLAIIDQINELILADNYYQALKSAWVLIDFEQEVLERDTKCP